MANRQTRKFRKMGLCTRNNGASTTVEEVKHGKMAFMAPDQAARWNKENGVRTWKVTKVHPANVAIGKR